MSDSAQPPTRTNLRSIFRRFRFALSQIEDFDQFSSSLEALLRELPELEGVTLEKTPGPKDREQWIATFEQRRLVIPLTGTGGLLGTLSIPDSRNRRRLGAQDIQLLSSLAGLASTLLDISHRMSSEEPWGEWIQKLFDSIPAGLILVTPGEEAPRLNQWSRRHLRLEDTPPSPATGNLKIILDALEQSSKEFHLQIEDTLLFVKTFGPSAEDSGGLRIALLYDLTQERNRVMEALVRESYRCNWKGIPLSLLLIQTPAREELLQAQQSLLQRSLRAPAVVGPVDAQTLAVVLPEFHPVQARNWLRKHRSLLPALELNIGLAGLSPTRKEGSELLDFAGRHLEDHHRFFRYRIALEDRYEPVNDTISLVLGSRFAVVRREEPRPTDPDSLTGLDGLVLDQKDFPRFQTSCTRAREVNPEFKVLLTSSDEIALPPEYRHYEYISRLGKPFTATGIKTLFQRLWPERKSFTRPGG